MEKFGYSTKTWQAAKDEIKDVLVEHARRPQMIAYSGLVQKIRAIDLQARDPRLDELLRQVASEEHAQGRGMLTVLVVHKTGDLRPGRGFYECARALGLDTSDEDRLWVDQFNKVHASWAKI
jgi:hypothetical protein